MIKIIPAVREQALLEWRSFPKNYRRPLRIRLEFGNPLGTRAAKDEPPGPRQADVDVPSMRNTKEGEAAGRYSLVCRFVSIVPPPRGIDAALAAARIFNALEVDFAILGAEEKDDGDSQRLAGEVRACLRCWLITTSRSFGQVRVEPRW